MGCMHNSAQHEAWVASKPDTTQQLNWERAYMYRSSQNMTSKQGHLSQHLSVCILVQAVQPKLEAMEAAWYRLHSISGAATPDQVIAYWEGRLL